MIIGYYCQTCESGRYLDNLRTGTLFGTLDQSGYFQKHTIGRPKSPANGVFYDTGTASYEMKARQIACSGFVEIEMGSGVNAYLSFCAPIAEIQLSGIASGASCL